MIRLQRRSVKEPADWKQKVDAAFPDAAAFWKKAKAFEGLAEQGAKRKKGFATYAPQVLPLNKKKQKRELPPVWQKHKTLKGAIIAMSSGYCAYCQSPVTASHAGKLPGQVEHFMPKSRFPTRAYDVRNYFLGCESCNGNKGDKWPRGGYVRPDRGKPEERFVFGEDGRVEGRAGDVQARNTVRDFDLNRAGLAKLRRVLVTKQLEYVRNYLEANVYLPERKRFKPPIVEAFFPVSEAINQNVQRVWKQGQRKKRLQGV